MTTIDIAAWLSIARKQLSSTSSNPVMEAQALLTGLLGQSRAWILTHPEAVLQGSQIEWLNENLDQLAAGKPLAYILGHQEFYGLDFRVSPAVLIPRPETELLVETAIQWLQTRPERRMAVDVGTGSGCIPISITHNIPGLKMVAADISRAALEVARTNVQFHHLDRVISLVQTSLLSTFSVRFDLVTANLPYIPSSDIQELQVARFEPRQALDGGSSGLDLIVRLLEDAHRWLSPGGLMLLEIEYRQGEMAAQAAATVFPDASIQVLKDLAGLPRVLKIENSSC